MSKRDPMSLLTLSDDPKLAREKIMQAYTGGRETIEIQRRLGGEADKCPIYELYLYHFVDDDEEVKEVYQTCVGGMRLCGECKIQIADIVAGYLEKHQGKKEEMKPLAQDLLMECKKSIWKRLERGWR
jgi:tryptophanyl-tRNA synthetase